MSASTEYPHPPGHGIELTIIGLILLVQGKWEHFYFYLTFILSFMAGGQDILVQNPPTRCQGSSPRNSYASIIGALMP